MESKHTSEPFKKGDNLQFHANRILKGNPVTGIFISEDEEWITVELTKDLEGMVNVWYAGEEKSFRKGLISNIKTT